MRKKTLKWLMAAILLAIIVVAIFMVGQQVSVSITETPVVTGEVLTVVKADPYDICYIPIA